MASFPEGYLADIYTEAEGDPDTLAHLGPLARLAGVWEGTPGTDVHPVVEGAEEEPYVEHFEAHPIDRQTNGPQLLYGLRYHTHIAKPGEIETFHDQVGYWLWEPATRTVSMSLAIPRAQVALAGGTVEPDATEFELVATLGDPVFGICSSPFLDRAFHTTRVLDPGHRPPRRPVVLRPGHRLGDLRAATSPSITRTATRWVGSVHRS